MNLQITQREHCEDERLLEKLISDKHWKKCPECGSIIEKTDYCNFIICSSILCRKKTYFCYICGSKLTQKTINSHFLDGNPYNNCIFLKKIDSENKIFSNEMTYKTDPKDSCCKFMCSCFNNLKNWIKNTKIQN